MFSEKLFNWFVVVYEQPNGTTTIKVVRGQVNELESHIISNIQTFGSTKKLVNIKQ